jgi:starch phosphorylase
MPIEQLSADLRDSGSQPDQHDTARHNFLWKLMGSYIPAEKSAVEASFVSALEYTIARSRFNFDKFSAYLATSYSVRNRLIELFNDTQEHFIGQKAKQVYYVSIEFLVGRFLRNALLNLELEDLYRDALGELGVSLDELYNEEYDPGLGNGGLGRLAACFMDSLATLNYPGWGYGLMYSFGMFKQTIAEDGSQHEIPDYWLNHGDPWRVKKTTVVHPVSFYGYCEGARWRPGMTVLAVANDFLIPGFATDNTLALRLWSSKPSAEIDEEKFRFGDYYEAIEMKQRCENLTSVLYPNDNTDEGKEMRLMQEYFMSSATLQDIIRRLKEHQEARVEDLPKYAAVQLNDTHPAIMVAELLRILMDQEGWSFSRSYKLCTQVFSYTCHTLMPEALEKWAVPLFEKVLPRHLQVIYQLNQTFLELLRYQYHASDEVIRDLSIVEEGSPKRIRMANLAVIGSHTVNGVAAIHSRLMTECVFKSFNTIWPGKFQNKTNGVTIRRWLHHCNPGLSGLITQVVHSQEWALTAEGLTELTRMVGNETFERLWLGVKCSCKQRLAEWVQEHMHVELSPETQIFDIQVKRIHEYKRQALNIFSVIDRYLQIVDGKTDGMFPRATMIGGKAAPGYFFAKKLIKLINNVSRVVNSDPKAAGLLQVLYLPNYNVSLAEIIIPGSDINQQISTAGTEASGTSNMKFAFNSSLIVGTWDGANIEIGEAAGTENVFFFGAKADAVGGLRATASQRELNPRLKKVFDAIRSGMFGDPGEYECIWKSVENGDHYLVNVDFQDYIDTQMRVDLEYRDQAKWVKKCIIQTANMGRFSSDRTITEYAEQIWRIEPKPLPPTGIEVTPGLPLPRVGSGERVGSWTRRHQVAAGPPPTQRSPKPPKLPQKAEQAKEEEDEGIEIEEP